MEHVNQPLLEALPEQEHEYFQTYFRIEAGYQWGAGMDPEKTDRFFSEMKALFSAAGWTVEDAKTSGSCPEVHRGRNSLYCHPMHLSGPCEKSLYSEVEAILKSAETCVWRATDTYQRIYDITDEQYQKAMEAVHENVEDDLMTAFTTSNRNRFRSGCYNQIDAVADKYRIPTLKRHLIISSDDVHMKYIHNVFQNLVQQGKIECKENPRGGKMYRALTGPELQQLARKQTSLSTKIENAQSRTTEKSVQAHSQEIEKGPASAGR